MNTGLVIKGSGDRSAIVCTPPPGMLKVIASKPGVVLAHPMAERSEPMPESALLVTGAQVVCATIVADVAESFPMFMSTEVVLTVTVFEIAEPGAAVKVTTRVIVAEPDAGIEPSEQFTVPLLPGAGAEHEPWLGPTETNVVPAGRGSLTVASVAVSGPLLLTVII
jgi:hypothetical protein